MCCGYGNACGNCTGGMVYVMEKLVSFCALTAVVMCIMATLAITLGLGIGLGYNYCFVDLKVAEDEPASKPSLLRSRTEGKDEEPVQTDRPAYRRSEVTLPQTPRRTLPLPAIKHTMALPLNGDFDFTSLLSKLRGRNRNVTLELIT